ncbi:unnamed protein product, partial [Didymodactylos carnosus]
LEGFVRLLDENIIAIFEERRVQLEDEVNGFELSTASLPDGENAFHKSCENFFAFINKAIMMLVQVQYVIKQELIITTSMASDFGRKLYCFQCLLRIKQINELEKIMNGNINENNPSECEEFYERAFIVFFFEEIMQWFRDQYSDINKTKEIRLVCHAYLWYLTQNFGTKVLNRLNPNGAQRPLQTIQDVFGSIIQEAQ